MANRRKLTDEQIEAIARRRENGQSYTDIAEEFGVSPTTIYRHLHRDYYARHKERAREYQRQKAKQVIENRRSSHKVYTLSFHTENDAEVIKKLNSVDNVQNYVRQLIAADISGDES